MKTKKREPRNRKKGPVNEPDPRGKSTLHQHGCHFLLATVSFSFSPLNLFLRPLFFCALDMAIIAHRLNSGSLSLRRGTRSHRAKDWPWKACLRQLAHTMSSQRIFPLMLSLWKSLIFFPPLHILLFSFEERQFSTVGSGLTDCLPPLCQRHHLFCGLPDN